MKKTIVGILLVVLAVVSCGCSKRVEKYTATDFAMGTTISEVFYGTPEACEEASKEVIRILKDTEEKQISWRVKGSAVEQVNSTKEAVTVDKDTLAWLEQSLVIAKESDGALNPGVGALAQLWDIGGDNPYVPTQAEITQVLNKIDYTKVTMQDDRVVTDPEIVKVDLGAIGKGIGADQALGYLKGCEDITGAIISVGGSLCVYGEKPDGEDWTVGVQDPRQETGTMAGYVKVSGTKFVSTSGDYEKYIEKDGKRYHHILDSKTGKPADSGLISVTIVCDSGLNSDALSTACFVLGMEKSLPLLEKYNAEAVFIDEDHNVYQTGGVEFILENTEDYQEAKVIK